MGPIHQRIFAFLCRPDIKENYLFEAVDQALIARKLGTDVAKADELITLLLDATERASHSTNFSTAKLYVLAAEGTSMLYTLESDSQKSSTTREVSPHGLPTTAACVSAMCGSTLTLRVSSTSTTWPSRSSR